MKGSVRERFLSKYRVNETSGCWDWSAGKDGNGYGVFGVSGRTIKAHRVSYELFVGPIPEGLCLDHLCRNRGCVNPEHLEAVTLAENFSRAVRPPYNGIGTHIKHVRAEVAEIRRTLALLAETVRLPEQQQDHRHGRHQ